MADSQTLELTDEHHDWVTKFTGVDTRAAREANQSAAPGAGGPDQPSEPPIGPPPPPPGEANQSVDPSSDSQQDQPNDTPIGPPPPDEASQSSSAVPQAGAAMPDVWQQGFDAGHGSPDQDHPAPFPFTPEAQAIYAEGVLAGQKAARQEAQAAQAGKPPIGPPAPPAAAPTGAPAADQGGVQMTELSFECEVPVAKAELSYVTAEGSVKYVVSYKPAEDGKADVETKLKFKDAKPEFEAAIKGKLGKGVTLQGGGKISSSKGSVGAKLDIPSSEEAKTTITFEIVKVDAKKAKVAFAELKWEQSYKLAGGVAEVAGMRVKYEGKIATAIAFSPNWKAIGEYAAKRLGLTVVEDAAVTAAAGGAGSAGASAGAAAGGAEAGGAAAAGAEAGGAAAGGMGTAGTPALVAAAPVAGVVGGIVGGFALCAGVCAGIGKLEDLGADAMAVCQDGERQLRAYAASYGSAMRGKPGGNRQGNDDAESTLQAIMGRTPGLTHDQAIEAATTSRVNHENVAYQRLIPTMRERIVATYKEKEGTIGYFFSGNVIYQVMNDVLPENGHY